MWLSSAILGSHCSRACALRGGLDGCTELAEARGWQPVFSSYSRIESNAATSSFTRNFSSPRMLAQIFQVTLVYSHVATAATNFVCALQSFGMHERYTLTSLESRVLESLFERCWLLDYRMITKEELHELQCTTGLNDKVRHIILSVITNANPALQLQQLLGGVGFSGCCLLSKLFHKNYVDWLRMEIRTRSHEYFATTVAHREEPLAGLRQQLLDTVDAALKMDIRDYDKQRGATNVSIDYIIIEMKKKVSRFTKEGNRSLWRLLSYWLVDASYFQQRKSEAYFLFDFLLTFNTLGNSSMLLRKSKIAKQIIENGSRDYIDLLGVLKDLNSAAYEVRSRITGCDFEDNSIAELIYNYTDHIVSMHTHKCTEKAIHSLHVLYFPAPEVFYKSRSHWN
ncbi:hypothetical protein PAPHI01_1785 [Pancytospora philotis]|nr:hypothetical protein PAPHI01_1785 [Pancytospora philotis]